MKARKAVECIDAVLNSEYHYDESLGYQLTSDDFEWLEEAKKALEKQIPKKPINTGREIVCPTCETLVGSRPYCGYCGQMLDHSTKESEDNK